MYLAVGMTELLVSPSVLCLPVGYVACGTHL